MARIVGCGIDIPVGNVAPGATVRQSYRIQRREDELDLTGFQGGTPVKAILDGYAEGGSRKTVVLEADGTIKVIDG